MSKKTTEELDIAIDLIGALKDKANKPRWDLLDLNLIAKVVDVYTYGAHKKYEPDSWQGVPKEDIYAALMRHITAWQSGEKINKTDGDLYHMAQVIWNALALLHHDIEENENEDNRY